MKGTFKKRLFKLIGGLLFSLFLSIATQAQPGNFADWADNQLSQYAGSFPPAKLHLHLDKTIYTSSESIWFSAYVLPLREDSSYRHQLLYVKLIREENDSVVRSLVFPVVGLRSYGNLLLPVALPTGTYRLLAFTNVFFNQAPAALFRQRIQVKTAVRPEYSFTSNLIDTIQTGPDSFRVVFRSRQLNGLGWSDAVCNYEIQEGTKRIMKGQCTLDYKGEAVLTIVRRPNAALTMKGYAQKDDNRQDFMLSLVQPKGSPQIRFYPEGGSLIANTNARLAIEAIGTSGQPLVAKLAIYENQQLIGTVTTNTNGFGSFRFQPRQGFTYLARMTEAGKTFLFSLPEVKNAGYSLQLDEAIVTRPLKVRIQKQGTSNVVNLIVHNFRSVFWGARVQSLKSNYEVTIPVDSIPPGLYAVTLLDERLNPFAERLLFIQQPAHLELKTNKTSYSTREKIELTVMLDSIRTRHATLSVSCADISRLDPNDHPDIFTSFFLRDELESAFGAASYFLHHRKERLEEILLTKGWRNYKWPDVHRPLDQPAVYHSLQPGKGRITSRKEKPPFDFGLFQSQLFQLQTDSAGFFTIPIAYLSLPEEKELLIVPIGGKKQRLNVAMDSGYFSTHNRLNRMPLPEATWKDRTGDNSNKDVLPDAGRYKQMETVVIQSKNALPRYTSKTCNDWVCQYNILNCDNHPVGSPPVSGETYLFREKPGQEAQKVIYIACEWANIIGPQPFATIKSLNVAKEFYKTDYTNPVNAIPEYLTTLYWNPDLNLISTSFKDSFYSSDLAGTFVCILEGIVNNEPVRVQYTFTVK